MKTLRLGIIGAENSHSWQIAILCNKLKKVPLRVTHIWGETAEAAKNAATHGDIPHIVDDWKKLLGEVDAVMIDHRDGKYHAEPARYFLERGMPTFADKPMTMTLAGCKELMVISKKKKTPLITFTSKPLQQDFVKFAKTIEKSAPLRALNVTGPADIRGNWGGIFFYGIHQVETVVSIMGTDIEKVSLLNNNGNSIASLFYKDGRIATLNFLREGGGGFHWRACTDKGIFCLNDPYDKLPYLKSAKILSDFVHTGKVPFSRERMLISVAVLETLQKSLKSGKVERIPKL